MYKDPSRDATEQPKRPSTIDKVQYILCVLSLFKMSLSILSIGCLCNVPDLNISDHNIPNIRNKKMILYKSILDTMSLDHGSPMSLKIIASLLSLPEKNTEAYVGKNKVIL